MKKNLLKTLKYDPAKALTYAYITAFALIALLTVSSHILTNYIMNKQRESAEISYNLGRQRGLVEQVSRHASSYYNQGGDLDKRLLIKAIEDVERSHRYITQAILSPETIGGAIGKTIGGSAGESIGAFIEMLTGEAVSSSNSVLYKVYYDEPYQLDGAIKKFLEKARWFAEFPAHNKGPSRTNALEDISTQRINILLLSLDVSLESYQNETVEKIIRFYNMQTISAMIIIIVLLAEASFIFRPLVARINSFHKILLKQALEDPLTGLDNRRAFTNKAEIEIKRAKREHLPIIVVLTDLDKFKLVNDTYGHDVGDLVLQQFAKILKSSLREIDIIGRIGGEEFALVLTRTNRKKAMQILERLRKKVETTPCLYTDPKTGDTASLSYTVSIGCLCVVPEENDTLDDYLKQADDMLYKAKDAGRNCVIMVGGNPPLENDTNKKKVPREIPEVPKPSS